MRKILHEGKGDGRRKKRRENRDARPFEAAVCRVEMQALRKPGAGNSMKEKARLEKPGSGGKTGGREGEGAAESQKARTASIRVYFAAPMM